MPDPALPRRPFPLPVQLVLGVVLAALIVAGYSTLMADVPGHVRVLFLALVLFSGAGGLLAAVRERKLVAPGYSDGVIRVGWVGDVLAGVAGGLVAFLIVPGLSANARDCFREFVERVPVGKSGTDFLEVAACAVVGGYLGRVGLRRAGRRTPEFELRRAEKAARSAHRAVKAAEAVVGVQSKELLAAQELLRVELAESRAAAVRLKCELDELRADAVALSLLARALNPQLPAPAADDLRAALAAATEAGRVRLVDDVLRRAADAPDAVADLLRLVRDVWPTEDADRIAGALAENPAAPAAMEPARLPPPVRKRIKPR